MLLSALRIIALHRRNGCLGWLIVPMGAVLIFGMRLIVEGIINYLNSEAKGGS
jgi:hypothetical protein